MVWPSFSQLGKIFSLNTFCLSCGVGHLTLHCLITSRLSCSFLRYTCICAQVGYVPRAAARTLNSACARGGGSDILTADTRPQRFCLLNSMHVLDNLFGCNAKVMNPISKQLTAIRLRGEFTWLAAPPTMLLAKVLIVSSNVALKSSICTPASGLPFFTSFIIRIESDAKPSVCEHTTRSVLAP